MGKRLKLILLFTILTLTSCMSNIRTIENKDHKECFFIIKNKISENANELYWRCRAKNIDERIYEAENSQKSPEYQNILKDIKKILNNRITQAKNANFIKTKKNVWETEHQICILKYEKSENFSDNYDKCRKDFLVNRTSVTPFKKKSYVISDQDSKNPQNLKMLFNQKFLDKRTKLTINEQAEIVSKLVEIFPTCLKYNVKSENFKSCIKVQNEIKKCHGNIPSKIESRKLDDKMFCKKTSVKNFPDSLAIYGLEKEVVAKEEDVDIYVKKEAKLTSVIGSKKGFSIPGLDNKKNKVKKEDSTETKKVADTYNTNFGPKFSKNEIVELREKSYLKCIKRRKKKLRKYRKFLPKECDSLGENIKEINL